MPILVNPESDAHLSREGYAVVDMFDEAQVQQLVSMWSEFASTRESTWDDRGFFTSAYAGDWQKGVDAAMRTPFADEVQSRFDSYEVFLSAFIAKRPGATGITPHLDWSYVDENIRPTFHAWTALQRIDRTNGALCVLPGSHHDVTFRRTLAAQGLDWATDTFNERASECRLVILEPGQSLIYDSRLLHFSAPNASANHRLVASFAIAHHLDVDAARQFLLDGLAQI